jgi:hypothetical protein
VRLIVRVAAVTRLLIMGIVSVEEAKGPHKLREASFGSNRD